MFDVGRWKFNLVLFFAAIITSTASAKNDTGMTEAMKDSLVYLQISYYGYEQYQPWRNTDLTEGWGIGVAVDKNKIITPAYNIANAAVVKAKRFGQNEFVPAKIKNGIKAVLNGSSGKEPGLDPYYQYGGDRWVIRCVMENDNIQSS